MKTKTIFKSLILLIALCVLIFSACKEETNIPIISDFKIYVKDSKGADSLIDINSVPAAKNLKVVVYTDADHASIWYGGKSNIIKTKKGVDSLDIYGNPVISTKGSDCYEHWGLLYAEGRDLTRGEDNGISTWNDEYVYSYTVNTTGATSGTIVSNTYKATVIVTNDGFDGPDFKQLVKEFNITVKYKKP
jgi:hypothetical protein